MGPQHDERQRAWSPLTPRIGLGLRNRSHHAMMASSPWLAEVVGLANWLSGPWLRWDHERRFSRVANFSSPIARPADTSVVLHRSAPCLLVPSLPVVALGADAASEPCRAAHSC